MRDRTLTERRQVWLRVVARVALLAWVPIALLCVTSLAIAHQLVLPRPDSDNPALARALSAQRASAPRGAWLLTHVLYGGCACSRRVLDHLIARGPLSATTERVVLAGAARSARIAELHARGFGVDLLAPEELKARYGVEAAPLLIISSPEGHVRYLGGYSERKQGPVLRDRELLAELREGRFAASLPVLGCAVSRKLQALADPWGLKYSRGTN